jgi:O-antigen/teichoic acid export membrane protein
MTRAPPKRLSLLRNSSWAAIAAITMAVSRFLFAAMLARKLEKQAFGQYAYGQWLVDLSFLVCSLGITSAISRYMAEYRHDPALLSAFVRRWRPLAFGLPLVAAIGVLLGAWLSGMTMTFAGMAVLAGWATTSGLWAMQTAALTGMQRFDLIFRANVMAAAVMLSGAFFVPSAADPTVVFGLMGLACLCASGVGVATTHQLAQGGTARARNADWRGVRTYAINMWISALVASLVWSRGELPVVKTILGDSAVAQYAAALAIYGAAVQAIMLGLGGVAPHITSLWGEGRKDEAIALGRSIMDLQLAAGGLGSLAIIWFGPEIVTLAFSAAYRESGGPLSILCIGLVSFAASCQTLLLQLETDAKFNRNTAMLGVVVLFAMAFILVPSYGLYGAASARIGAVLTVSAVTVLFTARRWGKRAISFGNATIVFALLLSALFLKDVPLFASTPAKCAMFALGATTLMVLLRGRDKKLVVNRVYRLVTGRRSA